MSKTVHLGCGFSLLSLIPPWGHRYPASTVPAHKSGQQWCPSASVRKDRQNIDAETDIGSNERLNGKSTECPTYRACSASRLLR